MPRRPKPEEIDFEIHVDQSCMSAPQDEAEADINMSGTESFPEETSRHADAIEELENQIREHLDQGLDPQRPHVDEPSLDTMDAGESKSEDNQKTSESQEDDLSNHIENVPADDLSVASGGAQGEASALSSGESQLPTDAAHEDLDEVVMQSVEADNSIEAQQQETDELATPKGDTQEHGEAGSQTPEPISRRESQQSATSVVSSPRRASGRTEALIHEAARNIVAQIEQGQNFQSTCEDDESFVSETETVERTRNSEAYSMTESRRSSGSAHAGEQARSADEGADSSSHHENEDDVFSDRSPRSSLGSTSDAAGSDADVRKMDDNVTQRSRTRSPRVSGVSGFSQYEEDGDDFIPTVRGTPRPPFRSPSSVKAIQMSSPPASVYGSPRSSRRTPLPTVSRLGSPGISAQYSPKKTPPRFKRSTPPLVLLHVTLLPLRWSWGDVLDDARDDDLSADGKNLRDAWRQLQDRMGDTTCERGILLPHPQNDYEVLEERLLEALELPLKRRARILECGHYLGPANEMNILDEMDSEEEFDDEDTNFVVHNAGVKTHWCATCRSDIRYDSLGAGKVFRVKVYASNGLMKAGAWDTCWKEMERVDVEIEPLVELDVHHELSRLQAEQERRLDEEHAVELRRSLAQEEHYEAQEDNVQEAMEPEEGQSYLDEHLPQEQEPVSQHSSEPNVEPASPEEARRLRDEERLREIYGHTPPATHPEPDSPDLSFTEHASPPSPSVEAFERRQERARAAQAYKSASLPELLLESVRVLMQDRKNVVILVMGLLLAFLALNGGGKHSNNLDAARDIERLVERREAAMATREVPPAVLEETVAVVDAPVQPSAQREELTASAGPVEQSTADPCSSSQGNAPHVSVSREVIRIVETVTETAVETATVTQTFTAIKTESVIEAPVPDASSVTNPEPDQALISEVVTEHQAEEEAQQETEEEAGVGEGIVQKPVREL
ncbi:hypothetical protein NLU13_4420 [Sarocladium strictum]|uniref:Pathway-specific nitrogen regulator n=1 Tax=Sarocladium strictum TaxID=5046 RepID=A0AA39L8T3_SARSR|nr:hypothetical protein NLU13_4420 [Sarocladium strictum]